VGLHRPNFSPASVLTPGDYSDMAHERWGDAVGEDVDWWHEFLV
jgi:hypothetical protein